MKVNIQNDLTVTIRSTTSDKFHYSIQTGTEKDVLVETSNNEKEVTLRRPNSVNVNSGSIKNVNNSTIIINGVHISGNFSGGISISGGCVNANPLKMTLFIPSGESKIDLDSSGCSDVSLYLDGFSLEQLNLEASGSSTLALFCSDVLNINSIGVSTSGSAEVSLIHALNVSNMLLSAKGSSCIGLKKSKFTNLNAESTGSASIDGAKSEGLCAIAKASGSSSTCGFTVSGSLSSKTSGSASISIKEVRS